MSQNLIQPVSADEVANGIAGDPDTLYRLTTAPWGLHRYIGSGLALQPVADHAALHLVAVAARIGAVVHREAHGERRRVDRLGFHRGGD